MQLARASDAASSCAVSVALGLPQVSLRMVSLLGSKVSDTTMAQVSRQMVSALGFDVTDPLAMGSCHVDASFKLLSDKLAMSEWESV